MKRNKIFTALAIVGACLSTTLVLAQDDVTEEGDSGITEEILVIGSRSQKARTISDSPVPVDVISAEDINALGGTADLTDNLKSLIPSYTATPATGDGSAFVRPTSLRGTASDQSLILVDGKRRHRSALVQFFAPAAGNGAHGVDIGMIPSIALKRVEVLRDGASSQYGSDAIAGVINFVTKNASEGGEYQMQYGQFYEGEQSLKIGLNQGFAIGDNGFLNLSLEYQDNEALSRGLQRPDAQALIDAGATGVGADSPFGDAPLVQTWGRPETEALRFYLNSGIDVGDNATLYTRIGYARTSGRYRFFYRNPGHSTLTALAALGYTGSLLETGFTPFLDGDQKDFSWVSGLSGEFSNGTFYDFSFGYGKNDLDYFLNNSINAGLGLTANLQIPQMDFDVGGYQQKEFNLNADFSTPVGDSLNVAYGFEWREETYTAIAGEINSYSDAGPCPDPDATFVQCPGAGVSGFRGIPESDAGEFSRDNFALYVDIEQDVSDDFMVQYALRYEDFSDFGSTINGKLAGRYNVTESTAFRGAISTGFHAPTPGQANVSTTITTFDGATGLQVEEGLVPPTDPRAIAAGGQALTEEKSFNISFGLTSDLTENTTLTLDFYQINVDDRIYRTGDITAADGSSISFYTNALDVEHSGVDLVITSGIEWSDSARTDISFAYGYNKIDVVDQKFVGEVQPVNDSLVEDIENNYPNHRFVLTGNTLFGEKWNLLLRANFYGKHFDERGVINPVPDDDDIAAGNTNPAGSAEIDSIIYIDLELGYQVTDNFKLKLGFANIFDQYVDEITNINVDGFTSPRPNRQSVGLQYPRRSAANYEGGSWYLGGSYTF
ncbi:MAG: TonB-dependent receptor [Proteobacteria bacterium]|nr:TonB-dependent receptor [Pseudomonadota bacterium]